MKMAHLYEPKHVARNISKTPFNHLSPELNPSAQRCLPRLLLGILIFKSFTARRLYKSLRIKPLKPELNPSVQRCLPIFLTGDCNF
jgi:hypothetical protein